MGAVELSGTEKIHSQVRTLKVDGRVLLVPISMRIITPENTVTVFVDSNSLKASTVEQQSL